MSLYQKFILWIYRLQRDYKFNQARKKGHFSDCSGAYEEYRTKRRLFLNYGEVHF